MLGVVHFNRAALFVFVFWAFWGLWACLRLRKFAQLVRSVEGPEFFATDRTDMRQLKPRLRMFEPQNSEPSKERNALKPLSSQRFSLDLKLSMTVKDTFGT